MQIRTQVRDRFEERKVPCFEATGRSGCFSDSIRGQVIIFYSFL
jgi:hypothetical protein